MYCRGSQGLRHRHDALSHLNNNNLGEIKEIFALVLDSELRARRAEDHAVVFRKGLNAALAERKSAVDDRAAAVANLESSRAKEAALVRERDALKEMVRQLVTAAGATTQPHLETLHAATQPQPHVPVGSKRKLDFSADASSQSGTTLNQIRAQTARQLVDSFAPLLFTSIATLPRDECRAYLGAMGPNLQGGNTSELRERLERIFTANGLQSWKKGDPVSIAPRVSV